MSKVRGMLAAQLRPPPPPPPPVPTWGPVLRVVRQGARASVWCPWWLGGLLEVVTYPQPRFRAQPMLYLPGVRAFENLPAIPGRWVAA